MRVFNESKTIELTEYDLEKGYLKAEKLFVAHHEAVEAVEGVAKYETVAEYPNGGKEVKKVWEVEPVEAREAWDEYEDIQVFVPYTEEELEKRKQEKYESRVSALIRAKYTLNQELSILRQRDTKPAEFAEYNAYAEECKAKAKAELEAI